VGKCVEGYDLLPVKEGQRDHSSRLSTEGKKEVVEDFPKCRKHAKSYSVNMGEGFPPGERRRTSLLVGKKERGNCRGKMVAGLFI